MKRTTTGLAAASVIAIGAVVGGGTTIASASSSGEEGAGPRIARHAGTELTGEEFEKVAAAVEAEHDDVTVEKARRHDDGTYGVLAARGDDRVFFTVDADLATVTERERGPGPRGGDGPGPRGTEVTGEELEKVSAAVEAELDGVTVSKARRHEDGTYGVLATRGEDRVHVHVSADLATVTERSGGPGDGPRGERPERAPRGEQPQE